MARKNSGSNLVILVILGLIAGTLLCYWQVRQFQFVTTDDPVYVYENPAVKAGLTARGFQWAFTSTWGSNWHPLTWLSHMADAEFYGVPAHGADDAVELSKSGGHHFTNLLFHLANTLLLFWLLRRMTGALWRSAFVAALFAWHPLHVESVAWVAERKDVLSTFFLMLTLLAYVKYAREFGKRAKSAKRFYALSLIAFACGLMSKPMLVTTPFLLLLLDFWPLNRSAECGVRTAESPPSPPSGERAGVRRRREIQKGANISTKPLTIKPLLLEKIPFLLLSVAACFVTFWVQKKGGSVMSTEAMPLPLRLENVLVTYVIYFGKLFWPLKLALFYPYPKTIPLWEVMGAIGVLFAVTLLAVRTWRKNPWLAAGWFWFLGTLVPVIGLVQVGIQSRADRYTYIPYIGLGIALAWGVPALLGSWKFSKQTLAIGSAAALVTCIVLTHAQASYWRNSFALFGHAVEVVPGDYAAWVNVGSAYEKQGDAAMAEKCYKTALQLHPDDEHAHYDLGCFYNAQGKMDDACAEMLEAIKSNPKEPEYCNQLGRIYIRRHKLADGVVMFQKAVALNPDFAPGHYSLGMCYLLQEKNTEAIEEFKKAVLLNPNDALAQEKLANTMAGVPDPAVLHYHEVDGK